MHRRVVRRLFDFMPGVDPASGAVADFTFGDRRPCRHHRNAIEAFSFYFRTRSLSFLSFLIDTMNLYMEIFGKVYYVDSFLSPSFPYVIYNSGFLFF